MSGLEDFTSACITSVLILLGAALTLMFVLMFSFLYQAWQVR